MSGLSAGLGQVRGTSLNSLFGVWPERRPELLKVRGAKASFFVACLAPGMPCVPVGSQVVSVGSRETCHMRVALVTHFGLASLDSPVGAQPERRLWLPSSGGDPWIHFLVSRLSAGPSY